VTFIIPIKIDSADRAKNLFVIIGFIKKFFNESEIIIVEQYDHICEAEIVNRFENIQYINLDINDNFIHKSELINLGIKNSNTDIVAIQDSDVFAKPEQYTLAIESVEQQLCDCSIPYDNITWQIPKKDINNIYPKFDFNIIEKLEKINITPPSYHGPTIGGILFYNKNKLIESGMYNTNFKGWGHEDDEMYYRFLKLGNTINRIGGDLYHIEHSRNRFHTGYAPGNREEYLRILSLSDKQLKQEIETWKQKE